MTTPPSRPLFPENSPDPAGEFPIGVKEYIFYLLFQAARHRDMAVDALLGPIGLSLPAWRAMLVVRRIENCTMKALARYSSMDRTTLTRTVDQLVGQGRVERCVPPKDRRQVNLTLSDAGSACYDQAIKRVMGLNRDLLDGIDEADLRTTVRTLQTLLSNMVHEDSLCEDLLSFGRPRDPTARRTAEQQA